MNGVNVHGKMGRVDGSTTDLNNVKTPGYYFAYSASTSKHFPTTTIGMLEVFLPESYFIQQRYTVYDGSRMFIRGNYGVTWSSWHTVSLATVLGIRQFGPVGVQLGNNGSVVDDTHSGGAVTEQRAVTVDPALVDLIGIGGSVAFQLTVGLHAQTVRPGSEDDYIGHGISLLRFETSEDLAGGTLELLYLDAGLCRESLGQLVGKTGGAGHIDRYLA